MQIRAIHTEVDDIMSKIFPNTRQRRKDAGDMDAIKRRQDARRFIEKQQELEDLIKELSL